MKLYKNKFWLNKKYIEEKLSMKKIANICNVYDRTIIWWLRKFKIKTRTKSEALKLVRGAEHSMWKGGRRINKKGYVLIWKLEHPNSNSGSYVQEHRLVMEKHLGRYLKRDEIIHHKDGNKQNNEYNNLYLTTQEKHKKGFGEAYQDGYKKGFITAMILFFNLNKKQKEGKL